MKTVLVTDKNFCEWEVVSYKSDRTGDENPCIIKCPHCNTPLAVIFNGKPHQYTCRYIYDFDSHSGKKYCGEEFTVKKATPLDLLTQRLSND